MFLAKPLLERQQLAAQMRNYSVDAMTQKSMQIMDVNPAAVQDCFRDNEAGVIIHGHTHRPAVHSYDPNLRRIVLGDWHQAPSYLSWKQEQGFELHDPRI
jgi:UDP-2,3-diacylglucosamine hydrolase